MPKDRVPRRARSQALAWWYAGGGVAWVVAHGPGSSDRFRSTRSCCSPSRRWSRRWSAYGSSARCIAGRSSRSSSALLLFVAGGAARQSLDTLGNLTASRSIVPDALTLPGYVAVGIGIIGFGRARRGGKSDLDSLLDAFLASTGRARLRLVVPDRAGVATPARTAESPARARVLPGDVGVLRRDRRCRSARPAAGNDRSRSSLLLTALSLLLVGDVVYTLVDARVASLPGRLHRPSVRARLRRFRRVRAAPLDARAHRAGAAFGAHAHQGAARAGVGRARPPGGRHPLEDAQELERPDRARRHLVGAHRGRDPAGVPFAASARPVGGTAHRAGDARRAHAPPEPLPRVRAAHQDARCTAKTATASRCCSSTSTGSSS